jgi:hypothetical protein
MAAVTARDVGPSIEPAVRERDAAGLVALGLGLAALWLAPYVLHGFTFPIGPDAPVYLWWTRLAGSEGLSVVARRPGVPALLLSLAGALHLPLADALGGTLIALTLVVAFAAAALVRGASTGRARWLAAAALAGLFARFLVWGYLANLVFAALFLAAIAVLASRAPRRSWLGAALLGAAGLVHPYFFAFGAAVLLVAVGAASLRDGGRPLADPWADVLRALAIGGAVAGLGLVAASFGPRVALDYSPDAVLRHAGLRSVLPGAYRAQFRSLGRTDGWWLVAEAGLAGVASLRGVAGRLLGSWALLTVLSLPVAIVTLLFAGQRLIFFAFCLPILAGVGSVALAERSAHGRWRWALPVIAVAVIAVRTAMWWTDATPIATPAERAQAIAASGVAASLPPGTHLVVAVSSPALMLDLPTRALNLVRAELPPDRIADLSVYYGSWRDVTARRSTATDPIVRSMDASFLRQIPAAADPVVLVPAAFNTSPIDAASSLQEPAPGLFVWSGGPLLVPGPGDPVPPSSAGGIALATALAIAALAIAGAGWSRLTGLDRFGAIALSPALGLAALVVAGVAFERCGLPLDGSTGPTVVLAVATLGGVLAARLAARRLGGGGPAPADNPNDG